jgi:hypothetical protein
LIWRASTRLTRVGPASTSCDPLHLLIVLVTSARLQENRDLGFPATQLHQKVEYLFFLGLKKPATGRKRTATCNRQFPTKEFTTKIR